MTRMWVIKAFGEFVALCVVALVMTIVFFVVVSITVPRLFEYLETIGWVT